MDGFKKCTSRPARLRQPGEAVQDRDAFLIQCGGNRSKIRKIRSHRIKPDRASCQEAACPRSIGVFKDSLEFVMRRAPGKQNPGDTMLVADFSDGIELSLRGHGQST